MVAEGGTVGERTVQFIVSRDENATLDRDITVVLSTSDGTALGWYGLNQEPQLPALRTAKCIEA